LKYNAFYERKSNPYLGIQIALNGIVIGLNFSMVFCIYEANSKSEFDYGVFLLSTVHFLIMLYISLPDIGSLIKHFLLLFSAEPLIILDKTRFIDNTRMCIQNIPWKDIESIKIKNGVIYKYIKYELKSYPELFLSTSKNRTDSLPNILKYGPRVNFISLRSIADKAAFLVDFESRYKMAQENTIELTNR